MKKSIGRTLAHIDVTANTSVRIHEDFFNSHRISRHLSGSGLLDGFKNAIYDLAIYQAARHSRDKFSSRSQSG